MKLMHTISQKLSAMTAVAVLAGGLGFGALGFGATASAQAMPTTKADCANWQNYGFKNRGACVSFVATNAAHGNSYGNNGGGNGNGGSVGAIGQIISSVLNSFVNLVRTLFSFFF